MYKMDKSVSAVKTFEAAEKDKIFHQDVSLKERLNQAWYLTAMAFGIDPLNPPKFNKHVFSARKQEK
jgi:hypothetical protein